MREGNKRLNRLKFQFRVCLRHFFLLHSQHSKSFDSFDRKVNERETAVWFALTEMRREDGQRCSKALVTSGFTKSTLNNGKLFSQMLTKV